MTLEDLLTHYADEFHAVAKVLEAFRDKKFFVLLDSNDKSIPMKTAADLKNYLQSELDAFQQAIDELE